MPSREDLLKNIDDLQNKASFLADTQAKLDLSVKSLEKDIENLKEKKSSLELEIDKMRSDAKSRITEKESLLNQRDVEISAIESEAEDKLKEAARIEREALEKEEALQMDHIRLNNKEDALKEIENALSKKQEYFDEMIKDYNARRDNLNAMIEDARKNCLKIMSDASALAMEKASFDSYVHSVEKRERDVLSIRKELDEEKISVVQNQKLLKEKSDYLSKKEADIEKRKAELAALEKEHEGHLKIIEEENKKIQLAWLQVNERIKKKELDIKLEELKK